MIKEYVFWAKRISRSAFFSNGLWNIPKKFIKIVVTESQVRFDSPIEQTDNQNILVFDLTNITQITWSITSPGSIGSLKISMQNSEHYYLTLVNPLDPTLLLVQDNTDELIAFCNIVESLKNNQVPGFDENPYIRQFQKKAKPSYLKDKRDITFWNKNVSPLQYYYKFVPESKEKEIRLVAQVYKIVTLGAIIISVVGILYILCFLKW